MPDICIIPLGPDAEVPEQVKNKVCPYRDPLLIAPQTPDLAKGVRSTEDEKAGMGGAMPHFWPCIGESCATWDTCQGNWHPETVYETLKEWWKETGKPGILDWVTKAEGLRKAMANPIIGPMIKRLLGG